MQTQERLSTMSAAAPVKTPSLEDTFPWIRSLSQEDREAFSTELRLSGAEAGRVIAEWENSAHIYEDPALVAALTAPIEL